jgi:cyclophilin family peptidyl-prolyl cis-trans isomerase
MLRVRLIIALVVSLVAVGTAARAPQTGTKAPPAPAAPTIVLETSKGTIEIETLPDSPKSVAYILGLIKTHYYRGQRFHWIQPNLVQFGDPVSRDMSRQEAWGKSGNREPVGVAETSKRNFDRGIVGLAYRTDQRPIAAAGQLFILKIASPGLNGKYAVIGRVKNGMNVVDKIEMADLIKSMTVK